MKYFMKGYLGFNSEAGGELNDILWGSKYPSNDVIIADTGVGAWRKDRGGSSSDMGVWYPRGEHDELTPGLWTAKGACGSG